MLLFSHIKQIDGSNNRLELHYLDIPIKNAEKQSCRYELAYFWGKDGSVDGVEYLYYPTKEIKPILPSLLTGTKTLFDFFRLFP